MHYQQCAIRKGVKKWPNNLIRKTRKINKQQIPEITNNIRASLILRSFSNKIPKKLFERQTSQNQTNVNRVSVRFENDLITPQKSVQVKANFDETDSEPIELRNQGSSIEQDSSEQKKFISPVDKIIRGLKQVSPQNIKQSPFEFGRRISTQIKLKEHKMFEFLRMQSSSPKIKTLDSSFKSANSQIDQEKSPFQKFKSIDKRN